LIRCNVGKETLVRRIKQLMRFVHKGVTAFIFLALIRCKKDPGLRASSSVPWKDYSEFGNKTDHITVCLDSLVEDSRCPTGVVCVWQGTAIAKFSVTVNNNQEPVTLSTGKLPGFPSDTILMGYKIEFINLLPYPEINVNHDISEYRAEVKITKQ
jgi:hypothetical protein